MRIMKAARDVQWLEGRGDREVVFRGVWGSRAFGTALPGSDTDIRGVFAPPVREYARLAGVDELVADARHNTVYYAARRYCELLAESNPAALELLWLPEECVLKRTPAWAVLEENRRLFVTRRAVASHSGYALAQIKKARGANKRVWNPQPEAPPKPEDHCAWIGDARGPALPLDACGVDLGRCRMARLSRGTTADLYAVYDFGEPTGGVFRDGAPVADDIAKSDAGRRIGLLAFDKQAFEIAKRQHRQYWQWRHERNEDRWRSQERGEMDFDAKNMMHLVRLLYSGCHIVETGEPMVRFTGEPLATLLSIRRGERSFDGIMELADVLHARMEAGADRLPPDCDRDKVEALLEEVMEKAGAT
jgi:predicted nucleotidyltransferase